MSLLLAALLALQDAPLVLKGARVVLGTGEEIERGTLVIRGGRLVAVGREIAPPEGAVVEDLAGKVVFPGMIDAASSAGIEGASNEESSEVTPGFDILDAVNPSHGSFTRIRSEGVTTVGIAPGQRNVIAGLGAVMRSGGGDRLLARGAFLQSALGSGPSSGNFPPRGLPATFYARRPTTRMGVVWEFRKAFTDADSELLARARQGKLRVRVFASEAGDVETALGLAREWGLSIVVEEGREAWRRAAELAAARVPVLLRPSYQPAPVEDEPAGSGLVELLKAGVKVALLPADGLDLRSTAAWAMKFGLSRADAVKAVTGTPAEILGVESRVGTLVEGREADLSVWGGDPLDPRFRPERVMIGGRWMKGAGR
jgi:imidazolonepropionase-like amidohydrolase